MGQDYKRLNHSVSLINFHFVWIPKRRKNAKTAHSGVAALWVQILTLSALPVMSVQKPFADT